MLRKSIAAVPAQARQLLCIACLFCWSTGFDRPAHADGDNGAARTITDRFQIFYAPPGQYHAEEILGGSAALEFVPLDPPANINRTGQEAWLQATLPDSGTEHPFTILEIPGQIFNYIDVWFSFADGSTEHYYAGDRYPYAERAVKHASYAFPVSSGKPGPTTVLIRARNKTAQPMNFAALLWPEEQWDDYILAQRLWYGVFMGVILALSLYNLFLAFSLKDVSYIYYVGYMLSLGTAVAILSGMADEYIWNSDKPLSLVSFLNGAGTLFAVAFGNRFLNIRKRWTAGFRVSTAMAALATVSGFYLIFSDQLPLIPAQYSAGLVQMLSMLGVIYLIGVALDSYIKGLQQARFLALGMVVLLTSLVIYFSYTHAHLDYNNVIGHSLEFGAVIEGLLLSLALADRIRILERDKRLAERALLEGEMAFSRRLIETQENERRVLSEALHDSIGHAVLVLKINLAKLAEGLRNSEGGDRRLTNEELGKAVDQCGEIMDDVRQLSHDLHPHLLRRLGLRAALDSTFERALEPAGISWQLDVGELPERLESQVELTTYRVIQELLSNILKYAEATRVKCEIRTQGDRLLCNLEDDGRGYEVDEGRPDTLGVEENAGRIRVLGGRYQVESNPALGTRVRFELPLKT